MGYINNLIRGKQITLYFIRTSLKILKLWFFIFIINTVGWYFYLSKLFDGHFLIKYAKAYANYFIDEEIVKPIFKRNHMYGKSNMMSTKAKAKAFIKNPYVKRQIIRYKEILVEAIIYSFLISGGLFIVFVCFFSYKGRKQRQFKILKGKAVVSTKKNNKQLKREKNNSDIHIGGSFIVKDTENQHFLFCGSTGTGKTVALLELMDQARFKRQRAIVYDVDGVFVSLYYRPGIDVLLNPADVRCASWTIWQEGTTREDFESIATSFIAESGADPFYTKAARIVFVDVALKLQKLGIQSNKIFVDELLSMSLKNLEKLLQNTFSESLMNKNVEEIPLFIRATLDKIVSGLTKLSVDPDKLFSIEKWLANEDADSWLFISVNQKFLASMKPLVSLWLDSAARGLLTLRPSRTRRVWFFVDEFFTLQRMPSLENLIKRGRKQGACVAISVQNIFQLYPIYGRNEALSLLSSFGTMLFLRIQCPDTAKWMSSIMGEYERLDHKEDFYYNENGIRDWVFIYSEKCKGFVVSESEFLTLDNLHGYILLRGNYPVVSVELRPCIRGERCPSFIRYQETAVDHC